MQWQGSTIEFQISNFKLTMFQKTRLNFPIFLYIISIFSLFLYSFTQIDLSLTFSRIEILRNIVSSFQYIGYFNRPLSTLLYIAICVLLFGFYIYFLRLSAKGKLSEKLIWRIILITTAILFFSYNAFSYDLFNYIFDAKIYTHYHLNPYFHKALDFPGDPMLSFMRWTHRTYPYGPIWLILTIPISYIGSNIFLPTLFMFKALIAASYLGSVYVISKIIQKISPKHKELALVFFALNPLMIIENLVSAHLDVVMMFFALVAFYKLINKKYLVAVLFLLLSIETKFATFFLIPIFIYVYLRQREKKQINWNFVFLVGAILMFVSIFLSSYYSGNYQPWYLILPLTIAAFIMSKYYILIPAILLSVVSLFTYVPFLYTGNWDPPIPSLLSSIYVCGILVSSVTAYIFRNREIKLNEK